MQQSSGLFACHALSRATAPSFATRFLKSIMINVVIPRLKCYGWQLVRLLASDTRIRGSCGCVSYI